MPVTIIKQDLTISKATLKPWSKESTLVIVSSKGVLSDEEKEEVCRGIRIAFGWCFAGEPWPTLSEIKQAIKKDNPLLAKRIISRQYY